MQHIYIGDEGKGFPLVLIHGFLGSSKMWEPQINFFKNYFRVTHQICLVLEKAIKRNHTTAFNQLLICSWIV